jgi:hypothetical protein
MTVRFNSVQEFEAELRADPPKVLRATKSFAQTNHLPIQHVSVIATFLNSAGQIVRLDRYVGQYLGRGPETSLDRTVMDRADKVLKQLEMLAREFNIEVRAGLYEICS